MPPSEFRAFIGSAASEYHGDTYNLISKNCNHFTDDIAWRLTGKHIPGWVNQLARLGALCGCLLPESLQATTVKQLPEYHECTEYGTASLSTATPHESTEIDDTDQEKLLLSPSTVNGDVSFVISRREGDSKDKNLVVATVVQIFVDNGFLESRTCFPFSGGKIARYEFPFLIHLLG